MEPAFTILAVFSVGFLFYAFDGKRVSWLVNMGIVATWVFSTSDIWALFFHFNGDSYFTLDGLWPLLATETTQEFYGILALLLFGLLAFRWSLD